MWYAFRLNHEANPVIMIRTSSMRIMESCNVFFDVQQAEACRRLFIMRLSSRAMCTLSSHKPCCWGNMSLEVYVSLYHLWLVISCFSSGKDILWHIYTSLIIKGGVLKAQSGLIKFGYGSVVEHPSLASRVSFDKFPWVAQRDIVF